MAQDDSHSSKHVRPDTSTSWEELSQATRVLLPSYSDLELQEYLIELMSSVLEKFPFFMNYAGYQQALVCVALKSLADDLDSKAKGLQIDV